MPQQIRNELLLFTANPSKIAKWIINQQLQKKGEMSILQDYFQLKNEWKPISCSEGIKEYHHIYSRQQIEQHSFNAITIKQLDMLTSRENYSFPFCPKIYKCSIIKSYYNNNNLLFDVALISEKLNKQPEKNILKKIQLQLEHIVLGFQYLFKRYAPFLITDKMIGWNQYNIPKVWFNQQFLSPDIQKPASNEEEMVKSLLVVIEEMLQIKFANKNITNFNTLIEQIDKNQYKKSNQGEKKVKFDGVENPRYSSSNKSSESLFPRKLNKITFVYSNRTIHSKNNEIQSLTSVEQLKQQRPNFIQFDKRSKRSKSSTQSINRKTEQFKQKMQVQKTKKSFTLAHSLQDVQDKMKPEIGPQPVQEQDIQKQNLQVPKRKENKNLTFNFNEESITLLRHHSRRYSNSNNLLQQQTNYMVGMSLTEQKFHLRRKQSLLREQLEQCLDGLFGSQKQTAKFDEKQLEMELDGVL